MKSKSQQRREAVLKTGKLPELPKSWGKVKGTTTFDSPTTFSNSFPFIITFYLYDDNTGMSYLYEQSSFRTKALALAALRKVKKVLKEARKS